MNDVASLTPNLFALLYWNFQVKYNNLKVKYNNLKVKYTRARAHTHTKPPIRDPDAALLAFSLVLDGTSRRDITSIVLRRI